jgi:hypothetical protein
MFALRSILCMCLLLAPAIAVFFLNDTINASTCADPVAYTECYDLAVSSGESCVSKAQNNEEEQECGCVDFIQQINCFAEACWNRVRLLVLW